MWQYLHNRFLFNDRHGVFYGYQEVSRSFWTTEVIIFFTKRRIMIGHKNDLTTQNQLTRKSFDKMANLKKTYICTLLRKCVPN